MNTRRNPIHVFSENPVSGYPLTDGELLGLADHWWNAFFDLETFLILSGSFGGAEQRDRDVACARLSRLADLLGRDVMDCIRNEVEAQWAEGLGDEYWTAFKAGRPLFQEEAAEGMEQTAPAGDDEEDEIIT